MLDDIRLRIKGRLLMLRADAIVRGGAGSGDFNHEGRPGEVGGSGAGGGSDQDRAAIKVKELHGLVDELGLKKATTIAGTGTTYVAVARTQEVADKAAPNANDTLRFRISDGHGANSYSDAVEYTTKDEALNDIRIYFRDKLVTVGSGLPEATSTVERPIVVAHGEFGQSRPFFLWKSMGKTYTRPYKGDGSDLEVVH